MKKILCLLLVILSMCGLFAHADTDYSFMDGMTVAELEAVIAEAQKRIDAANKAHANANPDDLGIWTIAYYVDEFGLPTDIGYLTETDWTQGTFSNSAVTNRKLYTSFLIDTEDVAISLYEYGEDRVKNAYSKTVYYTVLMMDANGVRTSMKGYMISGGNRIHFYEEDEAKILAALKLNGTIRFVITNSDHPTTKYNFTIENTSYFDNAYNKLLGK